MFVKMTAEYGSGIIGGIGVGLALSPLAVRWIAVDPVQLSLAGAVMACVGGLSAYMVQKRAAQKLAHDPLP
jgi:hypothetical protein